MEPFIGEIKIVPWNWAPRGWALCDGTLMSIAQNTALFSLLGTQYGGNGQTTFALPDLRSRVPIHAGQGYTPGQTDGVEQVTLPLTQLPSHNHALQGTTTAGSVIKPNGYILANVQIPTPLPHYAADTTPVTLNPNSVQPAGGGQPHDNMQPYLVLNYVIALLGVFPPRN